VVVAVAAMRVMEMSVDEIVDVVAMRDGLVAATSSMPVSGIVTGADVAGCTSRRIGAAHFDHMLIEMIVVRLMEVAVVKIVHVIAVLDGDMAATGSVNMVMPLVNLMFVRHVLLLVG